MYMFSNLTSEAFIAAMKRFITRRGLIDHLYNDNDSNVVGGGPGSSVGIATGYGLDDPGIESRWGEIFRPSRPALWPTQPPVK